MISESGEGWLPTSAKVDADFVRYDHCLHKTSLLDKPDGPQPTLSPEPFGCIHGWSMRPRIRLAYVVLAAAALVGVIVGAVSGDATGTILSVALFVVIIANAVPGERGARRRRQSRYRY
jgi:hypothetical protein